MGMEAIGAASTWLDLVGRLVGAALIGATLGLNRELTEKPAGVRTHALVALGSALFATMALELVAHGPGGDATAMGRVIQGVITGVGFIGGGVILHRDSTREVHGLTTAATIWTAAALGLATALGLWRTALVVLGLALLLLLLDRPVRAMVQRHHGRPGEPGSSSRGPPGYKPNGGDGSDEG